MLFDFQQSVVIIWQTRQFNEARATTATFTVAAGSDVLCRKRRKCNNMAVVRKYRSTLGF